MIQKIRNLDPVHYVLYCIFIVFFNTCILYLSTLYSSDEVAKSGRTGITTAYTENMLSRKRTLWTA